MTFRMGTVRWRLTAWYSLVLFLIILAFSVSFYVFIEARLWKQLRMKLDGDFAVITQIVKEERSELEDIIPGKDISLFQLSKGKDVLFMSPNWIKAGLPKKPFVSSSRYRTVEGRKDHHFLLKTGPAANDEILAVAQDEESVRRTLGMMILTLALALPCAVALAALGGYFLAGRLLAPVGRIADKAKKITAENLSERLPAGKSDDEFGRLAAVFNDTLARLQDSFDRLKQFTADASHELRTPLTAIRSVGEASLEERLDPSAYRDRIGSMLEETARMTRLVESLLMLTRADNGQIGLNRKKTSAAGLVSKVVEDLRVLAEEKGQRFEKDLQSPACPNIDEDLIRQALVNVIDNAVKNTPEKGVISVRLAEKGDDLEIEVRDQGPGIPPEHQPRIFERFYRVEKDRSREKGGTGLGLAIAKWAVERHGGRIELESVEGRGSLFRIVLPKNQSKESDVKK